MRLYFVQLLEGQCLYYDSLFMCRNVFSAICRRCATHFL